MTNRTKLEQWAVELFRRAVEAYGGQSIPGETECYAARVIQSAFEDRERKLREALKYYAKDYDYERGCSQWDGGALARATLGEKP